MTCAIEGSQRATPSCTYLLEAIIWKAPAQLFPESIETLLRLHALVVEDEIQRPKVQVEVVIRVVELDQISKKGSTLEGELGVLEGLKRLTYSIPVPVIQCARAPNIH